MASSSTSPRLSTVESHDSTVLDHPEPVRAAQESMDEKVDFGKEADVDPYLVAFDPSDPNRPMNWSIPRKIWSTFVAAMLVLNATFASSAPSGIVPQLMEYYKFSQEVAILTIALFVAGYCVGPLLWGPLSEQYGRRPIFLTTFVVYTGFQVGCALSKNTASIIIFRFLGGIFAAAPLTNSGALVSDIWNAASRGKALAFFTVAPFAGPALAPIVSGYIAVSGVSFRWVFWVLTIFAGLCFLTILFTLPETYEPILRVKLAQKKRKETGDERYYAPIEKLEVAFVKRVENTLIKPFRVFVREPMLMAITAYMSFVYGCVYLNFEAYPIVFTLGHGMNPGESGLMFLPIFVGGILGVIIYLVYWNPVYEKLIAEHSPRPVPPEARLQVAKWAAPLFAISFFWFGWTSYPTISYWAPLMSGLAFGMSVVFIFLAMFNYIIDAYLQVAASALAVSTVCRSLFGAAFPLFANQMYEALNPRWGSTLLGCIAILGIPIPFVLHKYGPKLRVKSRYAPAIDVKPVNDSPA